jgi:phosphoribosylaminoimidazolecarboxamide formyltransferase / IMP cyclohydrolase
MPRALISVSDKTGLLELGSQLVRLGFDIVSTGGTARALAEGGVPVVGISDVTAFPEMLEGRVKSLHPAIHGGILARRGRPDDLAAIERHGIRPIDMVVVNLYPFARAAARPALPFDELVEEIDIGGPSLVRAAAKNFRDVIIVVEPADYGRVASALALPGGVPLALRYELARKAFAHTARYDATIAATLDTIALDGERFARVDGGAAALPARLSLSLPKVRDLRYGENSHQLAAWYAGPEGEGLGKARVLQGKELSYTNLLDVDAAARIALEFDEPAAVVIKHTNPCGVATGHRAADAYVRAREADPLAAFGGIVGLNRPIDEDTARAIVSTFIEAVVAPGAEEAALGVLATKANLRVVVADFSRFVEPPDGDDLEVRSVLGGVLVQQRDRVVEAAPSWDDPDGVEGLKVVTGRAPTAGEWRALRFAWRVCAHVKSNAVLFASADRTLGIGAGQMSRVDAVKVAIMKATASLAGSVAASDAFFPFRDGLDAIAGAGATALVQPGGSVRDQEVITAADEHGLAMVFTGRRHFRH